ncbi:MAG: Wzz/FepE/Etk N-terminal domain-containing protein, partial [Gemmatimonadales bacterium]
MDNDTRLPVPADAHSWREENGRMPAVPSHANGRRGSGPDEDIDWRRWARAFWRHKWWIVAAVLLGTTPSLFVARNQRTFYQATVDLWINESQDQPWPIEVSTALTPAGLAEVMSSGAVLEAVVRKLKLNVRPERPADRALLAGLEITDSTASGFYRLNVGEDGTYVLLDEAGDVLQRVEPGGVIGEPFGFRWKLAAADIPAGREIGFRVMPPGFAANAMQSALTIFQGQDPRIFSVSYHAGDYGTAVDVIDALTAEFTRVASDLKRQEQATLVRTLAAAVDKAADSLRIAEANLQQFKVRTATRPDPTPGPVIIPGAGDARAVRAGDPVFQRFDALELERDSISQDRQVLAEVLQQVRASGTLDVARLEATPSV